MFICLKYLSIICLIGSCLHWTYNKNKYVFFHLTVGDFYYPILRYTMYRLQTVQRCTLSQLPVLLSANVWPFIIYIRCYVRKGALYHLSVVTSENEYPVSDNRTLNCEGVATSHIKWCETAMGYPFRTYTMSTSHRNPQLLNVMIPIYFNHQ